MSKQLNKVKGQLPPKKSKKLSYNKSQKQGKGKRNYETNARKEEVKEALRTTGFKETKSADGSANIYTKKI